MRSRFVQIIAHICITLGVAANVSAWGGSKTIIINLVKKDAFLWFDKTVLTVTVTASSGSNGVITASSTVSGMMADQIPESVMQGFADSIESQITSGEIPLGEFDGEETIEQDLSIDEIIEILKNVKESMAEAEAAASSGAPPDGPADGPGTGPGVCQLYSCPPLD